MHLELDTESLLQRITDYKGEGHTVAGKRALNYKPETVPAVHIPPNPKARTETLDKYMVRVQKDIIRTDQARNTETRYGGQVTGGKWAIVATDGHRALMIMANGEAPSNGEAPECSIDLSESQFQTERHAVIHTPEFYLAIRRALTMTDERTYQVKLTFTDGNVLVSSEHYDCDDCGSFEEDIPADYRSEVGEAVTVSFNGKFLETMCGLWPLDIWFEDDLKPVVFGGQGWRHTIAPQRDK